MAIIFTVPDIAEPLFDRSSGLMTDIWYRFFEEFERQMRASMTSINSHDADITLLLDFKAHTEADLDAMRKRTADAANVSFTASLGLVGGGTLQDAINNATPIDFSLPVGNRGSVLYKGAANWTVLPPGTAGDVLTTQGPGADPTWAAGGGGGGSVGPRQGSVTKPLKAAFTNFNHQASTVIADGTAGIMLTDTVASAANFRLAEQVAPAAPYSVYAHFGVVPYDSQAGLTLRDSSGGKLYMFGKYQNQLIITVWNSASSFAGNRVLTAAWMDTPWFRVDVTSTTITAFLSSNGLDWFQIAVETIASFLTAVNRQGFGIQTDTIPIGILCDSFSNTAPV